MAKTYEKFVEDMEFSRDAVFAVAKWAHRSGYDVLIPAIVIRPPCADPENYVDDGDIHLTGKGERKKLNVKSSRKVTFSGPEDYPYKLIYVSSKKSADRMGDRISSYVIVSKDLKYACVINRVKTKQFWSVISSYDRDHDIREEVYACPIVQAQFYKL